MTEQKKTVCLLVQRINRHGTEYIDVSAMTREAEHDFPCGSTWYSHEGKPLLEGLCLRGSVHVPFHDENRDPSFYLSSPAFYESYCVEMAQAKAMTATLTKVAKQIERDNAREPGDMFLALARAIGAQAVCMPYRGRLSGGMWRDTRWIWYGLTDGRNQYRYMIEEALREERDRQADRRKPVEPIAAE